MLCLFNDILDTGYILSNLNFNYMEFKDNYYSQRFSG
jgi:hypothetical protein